MSYSDHSGATVVCFMMLILTQILVRNINNLLSESAAAIAAPAATVPTPMSSVHALTISQILGNSILL